MLLMLLSNTAPDIRGFFFPLAQSMPESLDVELGVYDPPEIDRRQTKSMCSINATFRIIHGNNFFLCYIKQMFFFFFTIFVMSFGFNKRNFRGLCVNDNNAI